jgi:hypothetical protein
MDCMVKTIRQFSALFQYIDGFRMAAAKQTHRHAVAIMHQLFRKSAISPHRAGRINARK